MYLPKNNSGRPHLPQSSPRVDPSPQLRISQLLFEDDRSDFSYHTYPSVFLSRSSILGIPLYSSAKLVTTERIARSKNTPKRASNCSQTQWQTNSWFLASLDKSSCGKYKY
ncbi:hypothetical protein BDD12DRAFT_835297, partial [Trichophaea hybrida]